MSATTDTTPDHAPADTRSPRDSGDLEPSGLRTGRGTTTIADGVVTKIVALAAREVRGVASLGGPAANALGSMVGRMRGQEQSTAGIGVEVGQTQAAVDLTVRVLYPEPIKRVADDLRDRVVERVESMTGLSVVEVNVQVVDLVFPGETTDEGGKGTARVR